MRYLLTPQQKYNKALIKTYNDLALRFPGAYSLKIEKASNFILTYKLCEIVKLKDHDTGSNTYAELELGRVDLVLCNNFDWPWLNKKLDKQPKLWYID